MQVVRVSLSASHESRVTVTVTGCRAGPGPGVTDESESRRRLGRAVTVRDGDCPEECPSRTVCPGGPSHGCHGHGPGPGHCDRRVTVTNTVGNKLASGSGPARPGPPGRHRPRAGRPQPARVRVMSRAGPGGWASSPDSAGSLSRSLSRSRLTGRLRLPSHLRSDTRRARTLSGRPGRIPSPSPSQVPSHMMSESPRYGRIPSPPAKCLLRLLWQVTGTALRLPRPGRALASSS
jgi:hypothetical protein